MNEAHLHRLELCYRDKIVEIVSEQHADANGSGYQVSFGSQSYQASGRLEGEDLWADIDGFKQKLSIAEHDGVYSAFRRDGAFHFQLQAADTGTADNSGPGGNPRAPMTGIIVKWLVEPGVPGAAQTPLLVREAMKMEHTIRAPSAGAVTQFFFNPGDLVDGDTELLEFTPLLEE